MEVEDLYPSRCGTTARLVERLDPVVYARYGTKGPVSPDLIKQYDNTGFLILDNLFSSDEVAQFQQELDRLRHDDSVRSSPSTITERESGAVRSIFKIHEHCTSDIFAKLARDQRLAGLARYILDDQVYIHQSRVNYKPGLKGRDFYWHSDFETWHVEDGMPRMRALSISICLTENFEYNGPLMLIPGSHRKYAVCEGKTPPDHFKCSLKKQEYGVPADESLKQLVEDGGIFTATCKPGSAIVFDCNVMHGSNGNITPFPRSNIFFVFNTLSNSVVQPYCGHSPRPEYICSRESISIL